MFRAVDQRGFHWVVDEIWDHGSWKTIGEEIVRRVRREQWRVNVIGIDPLAKGDAQSDLSGESVYDKMSDLFMAYGLPLVTATKDKEGGIVILNDLLYSQNEMPALFIFDDLRRTVYEIEGWMYDETGKPSKVEDDMMENLYRLCLLGTEYSPPGRMEEYEYDRRRDHGRDGRNAVTGY